MAACRQLFTLVSIGNEDGLLDWENLLLLGRVTQQAARHLPQLAEYAREHPEDTTIFDSRVMLFRPEFARPDAPIVNATPVSLVQIGIFYPDRLNLASPGLFTMLREDEKIQVTTLDALSAWPAGTPQPHEDPGRSGEEEEYER